ncbi:MAG: GNAT family N-acetyltransferase [Acidobacteriota bacterium]
MDDMLDERPVRDRDVVVSRVASTSLEAQLLIAELDAEIQRRYPGAPVHGLSAADVADPEFSFYVARVDGVPAACGALRRREPGVTEVKRMFVRPMYRRLGLARQILQTLEGRAADLGASRMLLETGDGQPEAIALYRSAGYADIPRFGEYAAIAVSLCFEKRFQDA